MSTAGRVPARPGRDRDAQLILFGVVVVAALGAASAQSTKAAVAIAVVATVAAATVVRTSALLVVLIASLFVEVVSLGGLTISRLIAPVALAVLLVQWVRGTVTLRTGAQLGWVAAYATWALASLLWTSDTARTVNLLASLAIALTYMLAFAMLLRTEQDLRGALWTLAAAGAVVGLLSLAGVGGLGGTATDLQAGRAQGGVGDPNFFAALEIVAVPLVLALASSVRSRPARAALAGAVIVMLAAALDTLSRGGLLAMVAVLVVLAILPAGALLGTPRRKATVLLGVLAAAAVVFTLPGLGSRVVSRAQTIFTTTDTSSASAGSGRSEIWLAARHAVGDHPLLGTGFGAFPGVSAQYLLTTPGVDTQIFSPRPIEVHSAFLGTAAEVGLIGLVLFAGMLVSTALALRRTAVQAFRSGAPFVGRVANACLLALLAWGISSLFLETETARAVWILIGLSLALPQLIPAATRPRWPRASASPPSRG